MDHADPEPEVCSEPLLYRIRRKGFDLSLINSAECVTDLLERLDEPNPDIIIAVFLGKMCLIECGFNQSYEIARTFVKLMAVLLRPNLIYRNRDTEKQSAISFKERKNIRDAFSTTEISGPIIEGKHIGLIDDIVTTGHTLEEIVRSVGKTGAKRATNFVFARTPHNS